MPIWVLILGLTSIVGAATAAVAFVFLRRKSDAAPSWRRWLGLTALVAGGLFVAGAAQYALYLQVTSLARSREESHVRAAYMEVLRQPLKQLQVRLYYPDPLRDGGEGVTLRLRFEVEQGEPVVSEILGPTLFPGRGDSTREYQSYNLPWSAVLEGITFKDPALTPGIHKGEDLLQFRRLTAEVQTQKDQPAPIFVWIAVLKGKETLELFSTAKDSAGQQPGEGGSVLQAYRDDSLQQRIERWKSHFKPSPMYSWGRTVKTLGIVGLLGLLVGGCLLAWPAVARAWAAPRQPDPGLAPNLDRLDRFAATAAIVVALLVFHVMTASLLNWYYDNHLPHFDSIGSYTTLAQVSQLAWAGELDAAWSLATSYHGTWLQSMFALATFPVVSPTPAGYQWLNTLCVGAFLLSIYQTARALGAARLKAFLLSLLVFLPDTAPLWDGGVQDLKREGPMLSLIGATFFLMLTQLWQPTFRRALAIGLTAGLAVWSRGNALPYMVVILGPVVAVGAFYRWRQGHGKQWFATLALPVLVAGIVAAPNLLTTMASTYARYTNPVVHFGHNFSPWSSLAYYGWAPVMMWANLEESAGSNLETLKLALMANGVVLLGLLALAGFRRWRPGAWLNPRQVSLLGAGTWAAISTLGLICFGIGWDPRFKWGGIPPLYPCLLLPLTALIVFFSATWPVAPQRRIGLAVRWGMTTLVALLTLTCLGLRMKERAPLSHPELVKLAEQVTTQIIDEKPDALVAFLSHDKINFYTLTYFEARLGRYRAESHLVPFQWSLPGIPSPLDTASVLGPEVNVAEAQQAMLEQIREKADIVVVNTEPGTYAAPAAHAGDFFLFHHGAPVVSAILADEKFERVGDYRLSPLVKDPLHFAILRNHHKDRATARHSP